MNKEIRNCIFNLSEGTAKRLNSWSSYWRSRYPSNLVISIPNEDEIYLEWINYGEVDYENTLVERSTNGIHFSVVATLDPGESSYLDTSVDTSNPYWYRVRYYKSKSYSPPVGYEIVNSELKVYVTGLVTAISDVQLARLDTLITSLKTGLAITDLSEFFDVFRILAGETYESSLKNLAKNAHHLGITGAPTFTQFQGWAGNRAGTAYLYSDYQPSANAVRYALNDCAIGMYNRTAGTNSPNGAYKLNGASVSMINCDPSYYNRCQINDTSYGTITVSNAVGMRVTTRRAAGSFYHNVNNTEGLSGRASVALPNNTELVGYGADSQIALVFASKACSQAQITVIRNAVEAYMDACGSGVL